MSIPLFFCHIVLWIKSYPLSFPSKPSTVPLTLQLTTSYARHTKQTSKRQKNPSFLPYSPVMIYINPAALAHSLTLCFRLSKIVCVAEAGMVTGVVIMCFCFGKRRLRSLFWRVRADIKRRQMKKARSKNNFNYDPFSYSLNFDNDANFGFFCSTQYVIKVD